jgi:hypothetical protein
MNTPLLFWYESGILDTQDALYPRILVGLSFNSERLFFSVKHLYELYHQRYRKSEGSAENTH